tara:strand:+ start:103 stop:270 length:168 start_codon:yes stop_codon:yes gene_type:complete
MGRNDPGLGQALDEETFGHQECRKKNCRRDKGTLSVRQSANEAVVKRTRISHLMG